jgi:hypothetical protein
LFETFEKPGTDGSLKQIFSDFSQIPDTPRFLFDFLKMFKNTQTRLFFDSAEFEASNQNLRVSDKSSTRPTLDSTKEY